MASEPLHAAEPTQGQPNQGLLQPAEPIQASLSYLIWGAAIAQAVHVVAKRGIVDLLQDGPKTAHELAAMLGADPVNLGRVLRALTTFDIFREDEQQRFTATARGAHLGTNHPRSQRAMAIMNSAPFLWPAWGKLDEAVMTGTPAFEHAHGMPFFEYLGKHPDAGAMFNRAMAAGSAGELLLMHDMYEWSAYQKIIDIGGGHGAFLQAILERHPHVTGILADLPHVVAGADMLRGSPVAARCEIVGIDMFAAVPAGGDLYTLKSILHDWDDAACLQILGNIRAAIADGGKILHIGSVLQPSNQADFAKWVDLTMMMALTGRERTEAEFQELYAEAGFKLTRVIRVADGLSLVEGVAV